MNPDTEQSLERRMRRTLRALPDRAAPGSLEARVLEEIGRRERLPWWRRSYERWPAAARAAFVLVSAGAAAALVGGLVFAAGILRAAALYGTSIQHPAWLGAIQTVVGDLADVSSVVANAVAPSWLYAAVIFVFACYATLGGIGAAAYRTFGRRTTFQ